MSTSTFNAITYANKLKQAGLDIKVADVQAEEMSNFINNDLSTKNDLQNLELNIKQELKNLELRLIIKVGGMMFLQTGLLISLLQFLLKHN